MTRPSSSRSLCPIATSLAIWGDKWTMVLVRDMLNGKSRYSQFLASPERITTNILANRLAAMEADGLITRTAYQQRPLRYAYGLTAKGRDLHAALQAICRWGNRHYPDCWTPPASFMKRDLSDADSQLSG